MFTWFDKVYLGLIRSYLGLSGLPRFDKVLPRFS